MRESANYDVVVVPCVVAVDGQEVVQRATPLRGLYVRLLTTIASVTVRVGRNGRDFTLRQGEGIRVPADSPAITAGVYLSSPGGGGASAAELVLVRDDEDNAARGPAFEIVTT